jgi:hypothetical protein
MPAEGGQSMLFGQSQQPPGFVNEICAASHNPKTQPPT